MICGRGAKAFPGCQRRARSLAGTKRPGRRRPCRNAFRIRPGRGIRKSSSGVAASVLPKVRRTTKYARIILLIALSFSETTRSEILERDAGMALVLLLKKYACAVVLARLKPRSLLIQGDGARGNSAERFEVPLAGGACSRTRDGVLCRPRGVSRRGGNPPAPASPSRGGMRKG